MATSHKTLPRSVGELGGEEAPRAPGPRGYKFLGSLLAVRRDRIAFVTDSRRDYGDAVCFRMGPRSLYLLSHPEYARHVLCDNHANYRKGLGLSEAEPLLGRGLLTSEGELWAGQRKLLQAAFHKELLAGYAEVVVAAALRASERFRARAESGRPLDMAREMVRLTLDVLGTALFRFDLNAAADRISEDLSTLSNWAMGRMASLFAPPLAVPTPANLRARAALRRLERLASEMLSEGRRRGGGKDILSLLLASSTSERQARDEVMTTLLAGHETTAAALTWAWYLLSRHPQVEHRFQAELDETLSGRTAALTDVPRLTYLTMLISEVLRLYPPVWLLPRKALEDDRIGPYRVPAGSDVLLSVYSVHRHPDFWESPERFEPERFEARRSAGRAPWAYIPFGGGPRTCLGSRFGVMEAALVLAVLGQTYRFEMESDFPVRPQAQLTLRPHGGLRMRPVRRA